MSFEVLTPPTDPENLTESAVEVIKAAIDLGMDIEPQGFIYSWVGGSRLVISRDENKAIDGIAMFTMGKRWTHSDSKAHILILLGDRQALLDYIVNMAKALGITGVFYEESMTGETPEYRDFRVRELITG